MRLDHLLSKEEEVRVLYTVQFSKRKLKKILVSMRLGDTPVPIPNTTVKTKTAKNTILETIWEDRWMPDLYGGVAQLGEHLPCKQGVMSSNLTISTRKRELPRTYLENRILKN